MKNEIGSEIERYKKLNELAEQNGIVVFGSTEDTNIPIGELRQAFTVEPKMYNRSFSNISIKDALTVFYECVAPLVPETILIHIGDADLSFFEENPVEFDHKYHELITHIKSQNKKCRIAIISLKNYENDPLIAKMNKHLKYIADAEQCEYGDIAAKKVWSPKSTMDAVSFVYSIGFVHPLKNKYPIYDLVKILFCYEFSACS